MAITITILNVHRISKEVAAIAVQTMRDNIEKQGHNATGRLSQDIKTTTKFTSDGISIDVLMYLYGAYVNKGVSRERFRFGGEAHIDVLIEWAKAKGITVTDGDYKSFAFAVIGAHRKQGIPTKGSYSFSSNGKRLGFVDDAAADTRAAVFDFLNVTDFDFQINLT